MRVLADCQKAYFLNLVEYQAIFYSSILWANWSTKNKEEFQVHQNVLHSLKQIFNFTFYKYFKIFMAHIKFVKTPVLF